MKHLFTILAAILLASCASPRYASTYDESRDSTRVSTRQLDSIFARLMQRDSIYIRDSIYVREKGDTVTKYVERVRYQYKVHTDTRTSTEPCAIRCIWNAATASAWKSPYIWKSPAAGTKRG